ncbi:asparagine synthase-related protein [Streptomyces sp. HNM0574]|uniref:asparagine synthase-related protein n=1 Tax=Streptomyces sp. HNM0574 TaxID=2714954 RepID=UPI00146ECC66|nr:asparagine synthase-related protein [Streptomyces sp. HNM0574]NLU68419.1 asparagine synthase [Streptomyces sp. HNM0574]
MRWLVGWSSAAAGGPPEGGGTVHPVGAQLLWGGPDPLWAVGDWRPDEIRVVRSEHGHRLAVLGICRADDAQLRAALNTASGGAFRHLTAWPGSYTAVAAIGRRVTVTADLAGARPVFHTPWAGGTAYATAALPLADLVEAQLDVGHLGALLACPDAPEALGDGTPYEGVRRVPPGHALILREGGSREIADYEPAASLVVSSPEPTDPEAALAGVRDALVEAVRTRLAAPRHASAHDGPTADVPPPRTAGDGPAARTDDARTYANGAQHHGTNGAARGRRDPGPVPGMGPEDRRARRGAPAPGVGADLSGGPASGTLALLAAGLPGVPGTVHGAGGTEAGERLLAVTFNDLATVPASTAPELERARSMADNPRLHHLVVTGHETALPYADLENGPLGGPLTDEPGPSLVSAVRHRLRLVAGSSDHFVGHGARQVLDAHPARLADLLLDRRRRHLLRPVVALARAEGAEGGAPGRSVGVPWTVYRAARRLARTPYREGVEELAARLRDGSFAGGPASGKGSGRGEGPDDPDGTGSVLGYPLDGAVGASVAALAWGRPGPAARWLTGEALAQVALRLEAAAAARPYNGRPGERRARAALARQAADHRVFEQSAEIRNQRLHAPFLDNQVVRAARALPESLRVRPGARASVLRAVLAGAGVHELPPGWGAPTHTTHTAAARAGIRLAADPLLGLFEAPLLADAGLVEARVVRRALHAVAEGRPVPVDGLADLVSTEIWLRRLLARRGTCWAGADAPRRRAATAVGPATRPAL